MKQFVLAVIGILCLACFSSGYASDLQRKGSDNIQQTQAFTVTRDDNANRNQHCQAINVAAVNQKFDSMALEARSNFQRESQKGRLLNILADIESLRRSALQGCA